MKWAIRAQRVFDGAGNPVIRDAVVVVDDARIAAVGPVAQVPLPHGMEVLDVGDRTLMPGLIDAHVHMLFDRERDSAARNRAP